MLKCDLHIHSVCSDGRYLPKDIAKMAKTKGLDYFSLTDHDTLSGIDEVLKEASNLGVNFIPGIELSTEHNKESIHVLGFFKKDNYKNSELNNILNEFKENRIKRAYTIVDNLKKYHDIEIDINKVLSAGRDTIARPHIAKAIIDSGYPYDNDYIFDNFIGNNCRAYLPSTKISTKEGIELLKKYNALVFLAHPVLVRKTNINDLLDLGFDGLEAIYYQNKSADTTKFIELAKKRNLFISSGSDCHGIENDIRHGEIGDVNIPNEDYIINMLSWVKTLV